MADEEFIAKIKTIGVSLRRGTSIKKPVTDERDGSIGGYHLERWDDSQDAVVFAKTVKKKFSMEEE